jgi:hypothetical protein
MTTEAVKALRRLRAWVSALPRSGSELQPDPIKDLMVLIDARVTQHHHLYPHGVTGPGVVMAPGSHWEERQSLPGPEAPNEATEPTESHRRPGKIPPTAMQVLERVQEALVEAGMHGYSPLSVAEGVETLARVLRMTRETLSVAQVSTRQHLVASSHRAQIAEHYRAALQQIAEGPASPEWRGVARDALPAPAWDKRIRP